MDDAGSSNYNAGLVFIIRLRERCYLNMSLFSDTAVLCAIFSEHADNALPPGVFSFSELSIEKSLRLPCLKLPLKHQIPCYMYMLCDAFAF